MSLKIFVSSTYLDLKDYRIKAKKAIEESKNEFIGMEKFQSHTHEPSEFCAENVEECDAFVLIVAYRYGVIPESQTISITQLEYEHALRKKINLVEYESNILLELAKLRVKKNRKLEAL